MANWRSRVLNLFSRSSLTLIEGGLLCLGRTTLPQPFSISRGAYGRAVHLASSVKGVADGEARAFCCAVDALYLRLQRLLPIDCIEPKLEMTVEFRV